MTLEQQTPRRQQVGRDGINGLGMSRLDSSHERSSRQPRKRFRAATAVLAIAGIVALSGCSLFSGNAEPDAAPTITITTKASASPVPLTPAQELAKKVEASLTALSKTASTPNRDQMKQAMITAGADQTKLEISLDKTPTGLAVDAIEAATQLDKQCVIGQVRAGKAFVTVLPVLATGFCFIGNER